MVVVDLYRLSMLLFQFLSLAKNKTESNCWNYFTNGNFKQWICGTTIIGIESYPTKCIIHSWHNWNTMQHSTIDPSEARVAVPDERFDWLCTTFKPTNKVPGKSGFIQHHIILIRIILRLTFSMGLVNLTLRILCRCQTKTIAYNIFELLDRFV